MTKPSLGYKIIMGQAGGKSNIIRGSINKFVDQLITSLIIEPIDLELDLLV